MPKKSLTCTGMTKQQKKEKMLESVSFKNFLSFPFWMAFQFTRKPAKEAFFILVSEIFWRAGIACSMINELN